MEKQKEGSKPGGTLIGLGAILIVLGLVFVFAVMTGAATGFTLVTGGLIPFGFVLVVIGYLQRIAAK